VYPHDRPGAHVAQEYRPAGVAANRYYEPSDRGHEAVVAERLRRWRSETDDSDRGTDDPDAAAGGTDAAGITDHTDGPGPSPGN